MERGLVSELSSSLMEEALEFRMAILAASLAVTPPHPPLWTSTHRQRKVHFCLHNLKAGTMS